MSIRIKRTLYSLAATGALLAGIGLAHSYKPVSRISQTTTVACADEVPSNNVHKIGSSVSPDQAKYLAKHASFVAIKYDGNIKELQQAVKILDHNNVTYGIYAVNGNGKVAQEIVDNAPNAAYYMDAEQSSSSHMNDDATAFGKVTAGTNKPNFLYLGNKDIAQSITDNTRDQYFYNLVSNQNQSGAKTWQSKGKWANRLNNVVKKNKLNKSMPVELDDSGNKIQPFNEATKDAINDGNDNNNDNGSRELTMAGMQQWQHHYEHDNHLGPQDNLGKLADALKTSKKNVLKAKPQKRASKNFKKNRKKVARMSKKYNKQARSVGTHRLYYKPSQMRRAYVSMQKRMRNGIGGYHAPDGCEAASMDMGLHLLGLNKHETYSHLLNKIPWTDTKKVHRKHRHNRFTRFHDAAHNPERGYSNNPYRGGTGASLYPQELRHLAYIRGAQGSSILADNAFYKVTNYTKHYLAASGHFYGKKYGKLNNSTSKRLMIRALQEGHPIVIEATHDMENSTSDHVILLWGYKNGKFYWCDPNDATNQIPNSGGTPVSWNTVHRIMNGSKGVARGPRAVILAR